MLIFESLFDNRGGKEKNLNYLPNLIDHFLEMDTNDYLGYLIKKIGMKILLVYKQKK